MLIRITNKCTMGCPHCFVNATPEGEHMHLDTYISALNFSLHVEPVPMVQLSGGEPTEHPDLFRMLNQKGFHFTVLSNGLFLKDKKYTQKLVKCSKLIQVTHDPKYYKISLPKHDNYKNLYIENNVRTIVPLGRALKNKIAAFRKSPMCFNLRSATGHLKDVKKAIQVIRTQFKFCIPSIDVDGTIRAGECPDCAPIGNVKNYSLESITKSILQIKCNKCGLFDKLPLEYRKACGK